MLVYIGYLPLMEEILRHLLSLYSMFNTELVILREFQIWERIPFIPILYTIFNPLHIIRFTFLPWISTEIRRPKICSVQHKIKVTFFLKLSYQTSFLNINSFSWLKCHSNKHTYDYLIRYRQSPNTCNCRKCWRYAYSGSDCPNHCVSCL